MDTHSLWYLKKQLGRMFGFIAYDYKESRDRLKKSEDDPMLAVWTRCSNCGKPYENYRVECSKCGRRYD